MVDTPQKAPAPTTRTAAAARAILRDFFMTNLGSVDEGRQQKVASMAVEPPRNRLCGSYER
jgi:hypothetical protein